MKQSHLPLILLSFDVEEFDMPLEYGQKISMADQLKKGYEGLEVVAELMDKMGIRATYFTTANFAEHFPQIIRSVSENNEIASHSFFHSRFSPEDLSRSRESLERITNKKISGFRMPRMQPVDVKKLAEAGYQYDSSLHPVWLPGRYNNLHLPRTPFVEDHIIRIPASVSTFFRIPLFWLSFKNLPYHFYMQLIRWAL